ncbi:MAG: hypothetical protein ACI9CE_003806 [Flavobacterium sp.]
MKKRIAEIIRQYSAQGIHRTGTDVDRENAEWLKKKFDSLGVDTEFNCFAFKRIVNSDTALIIGTKRINAEPLYDSSYTDVMGLQGTLGKLGSKADFGVIMSPPQHESEQGRMIHKARLEGKHKAIIICTPAQMPSGITTMNAENFTQPFGPPVIQISNADWQSVQSAIKDTSTATLIANCKLVDAEAINVCATVRGSDERLAPLVIMTPRSGWWSCASERGGGIACLLEIMREVKRQGRQRDVIFTANTGHELSHIGLDHYLAHNSSLIADAYMWIHLGANFAAKYTRGIRTQFSSESAKGLVSKILDKYQLQPVSETPIGHRPFGEARNIHDHKGNYISLLGGNALFHHPNDVWPESVDLDTTAKWTEAYVDIALSLAQ